MGLQQLANEYKQTANMLESHIVKLKAELTTARGQDAFTLEKRIEVLYSELLDTRKIMSYLNQYYS